MEPGPPACPFDYLEVYDGNSTELFGGSRLCGRDTPPIMLSETSEISITFHTDSSDTASGAAWRAKIIDPKIKPKVFNCDFNEGLCGMLMGKNAKDLQPPGRVTLESGNF